ncbi:MAG: ketohydroxyglutarate aldolase [Deltaproteobacteria bacterium]|nr:ketohydroxyglutarate aldolase [Deltaproteobacteria bacterium]
MAKMKSLNITVLVDDMHKDHLLDVAKNLKDQGFVVNALLEEIGVITGSVPSAALAKLSTVPGVSAVEQERTDYRTQH